MLDASSFLLSEGADMRKWRRGYRVTLVGVILLFVPLVAYVVRYTSAPVTNRSAVLPRSGGTNPSPPAADKTLKRGLALAKLREAVRLSPTNGDVRAQLGIALFASGQDAAAEHELRQALTDFASQYVVIPTLLTTMLRRREIKELLTEFPEPAQGAEDKNTPDILRARAIALQLSGQPREARMAMDRSLGLRRDAETLLRSAVLAQQQGDFRLASSEANEASELAPTYEDAVTFSVLVTRESGDAQALLTSAEDYIERFPKSERARATLIDALLESKQEARAKQAVDDLLKLSPNSTFGRFYRGVLMARAKDFKAAWAEVRSLPPDFIQSESAMIASIAVASGNAKIASSILTTFVANNPDDRLARLQLAATWLGENDAQAAIDALDPIKAANDPTVDAVLAQAYLARGRFDDAIASLEIASPPAKVHNLVKQQSASSELPSGLIDQNTESLRELVDRLPDNGAATAALITKLIATSKWNEASAIANQMAKRAPRSPFPYFYQAQILAARGNLVEAEAMFGKALAVNPNFVPALYYRASIRIALSNPESAKRDLQLILMQNPTIEIAKMKLAEIDSTGRARSN